MTYFGLKLILNTNTIILHQFNNIKKLNFNTINNIEKKDAQAYNTGFCAIGGRKNNLQHQFAIVLQFRLDVFQFGF